MKVALISPAQTCGKTTFAQVLASVYSRTQGKDVAIISTGDGRDNLEIADTEGFTKDTSNAHVFKSIIEASDGSDKSLLNYGAQAGDEHVYIFDINGNTLSPREKVELAEVAVSKLPASLTLIEICGDLNSPMNQGVLRQCHVALLCVDVSSKSLRNLKAFKESLPGVLASNSGIVLTRHDPNVLSDKAMKGLINLDVSNILRFPYSPVLQKMSFNKQLDRVAYMIVQGDPTVQQFRMPMLEIMQYLFDTDKRKIIRGMDKWSK